MKKNLLLFCLVFALVFMSLPSLIGHAEILSKRLDGADRFEVAVNVSKEGWPAGSGTVILANYMAFADALAAAPLAYKEDAPILLTSPTSINQITINEIKRLHATHVILVGGQGSISDKIVAQLNQINIKKVDRIGGVDRFEVSYNIAQKLDHKDTAVLANGLNFPDALAIAPYAARNGYAILLSQNNSLPSKTQEAIKSIGIAKTVIVGGVGSVSANVAAKIPHATRIGGQDRFEVSANIIKQLNLNTKKAFLATGQTFADALTGSVLAAKQGAPLLLMHPTSVPSSINDLVKANNIQDFVILGGTGSVPNRVFLILTGQAPALPLEGKVIVVDPGHGGSDSGAVKNGYYEKYLNLQFAKKFAKDLQNLGAKVLYTRNPDADQYVSLQDRAEYANSTHANLFISIHHDSNVSSTPSGFSIHYSSYRPGIEVKDVYVDSNGKHYPYIKEVTAQKYFIVQDGSTTKQISYEGEANAIDPTPSQPAVISKELANLFSSALVYRGGTGIYPATMYGDNGVRDANLYVTRWTTIPSVLCELGFISNPTQVKLLADPSVQDARAQALANSIRDYFNK